MDLNVEDAEMKPLLEAMEKEGLCLDDDEDGTPYKFRVNGVTITYMNLQKEYIKAHKKIPKKKSAENQSKASWMRVKDGNVRILIEAHNLEGALIAKVVVQRERAAFAEARQMNEGDKKYVKGEVTMSYSIQQLLPTKWLLTLDLDSVYAAVEDGIQKEVYALCPSKIEVTNKFQLVTELYTRSAGDVGHIDRLVGKKESTPFLLRTEQRHNKSVFPPTPESGGNLSSESMHGSPEQGERSRDGSFDNLLANNAQIGMLSANVIQTNNRDIGYHIPLNNFSQKGELKEGDIVGFFEDENSKTRIEKLNQNNYHRAKLAGVITRSFYLEGLSRSTDPCDVVCVIGIVKVRVIGMVRNGDHLYAYKKKDGVAATQARLSLDRVEKDDKPFLIGQALEARPDVEANKESLVPAFVSLSNGIDCLAMNQRVTNLNEHFSRMIRHHVLDASKKIKRRFFWLKLLLLAILVTIGLALWQRYAPNTLLRDSICKRGSFEKRAMRLSFNTSWQEISITALEFKFKNLKEKLYSKQKIPERPGNMRYFINFERCKNRGVSYGNEYVDDTPTVAGPEILSSDENCTPESVKYLNEGKWNPLMTYKRFIKIKDCHTHL